MLFALILCLLIRLSVEIKGSIGRGMHSIVRHAEVITSFDERATLLDVANSVIAKGNAVQTFQNLVAFGDQYFGPQVDDYIYFENLNQDWVKVPGCIANVRINVHLSTNNIDLRPQIQVDGFADSKIARGLLAILCKVISVEYYATV